MSEQGLDLLKNLLQYTPTARLPALDALTHEFFDELRDPNTRLPDTRGLANGNTTLPPLFNFTPRGTFCPLPLPEHLKQTPADPLLLWASLTRRRIVDQTGVECQTRRNTCPFPIRL